MSFLFSQPDTPDYAGAAKEQGAANKESAIAQALLNNPNMVTPYGSSTYSGPVDGSGRQTLTQNLSPAEQSKLEAQQRIQQGSLGILEDQLPNIKEALSGPFGLGGKAMEGYDPKYAPTADTLTDINIPGQVQTGVNLPGGIQTGINLPGNIQTGLNFSGAPGMPQADARVLQQVEDAMYGQGAQYLDPQFKQTEGDMRTRLANQGIVPGTEAFNREMENFALTKQKAYGDLRNSSITGGQSAMQNLYNMAMAGRQQGVGEIAAQGQFGNSAQAQQAAQALQQGTFANTAQQQGAEQELQKGAFANTAQQQQMQNALNAYNARNQGVAQQAQIAGQSAQLANQGRAQNYGEYSANRTMPLNMLNAMITSSQVNNPTFQPTTPTQITPAPILQGAQLQGQSDAAGASANAGMWGSVIKGAATVAAAF